MALRKAAIVPPARQGATGSSRQLLAYRRRPAFSHRTMRVCLSVRHLTRSSSSCRLRAFDSSVADSPNVFGADQS